MATHTVNSDRSGRIKSPAEKGRRTKGVKNKNQTYEKGKALKTAAKAFLWLLLALAFLFVVIFFLFKSWTVYDSDGAHILFPWTAAANNNIRTDDRLQPSDNIILRWKAAVVRSEACDGLS
jgi:hypothetical protein